MISISGPCSRMQQGDRVVVCQGHQGWLAVCPHSLHSSRAHNLQSHCLSLSANLRLGFDKSRSKSYDQREKNWLCDKRYLWLLETFLMGAVLIFKPLSLQALNTPLQQHEQSAVASPVPCCLVRRGTLTQTCAIISVSFPHAVPALWECWGCETAAGTKLHVSYLHYNRLSSFSTEQPLIIQQSFIHPLGEALNCGPFCLSLVIIQVEIRNPRVLFKKNRG